MWISLAAQFGQSALRLRTRGVVELYEKMVAPLEAAAKVKVKRVKRVK